MFLPYENEQRSHWILSFRLNGSLMMAYFLAVKGPELLPLNISLRLLLGLLSVLLFGLLARAEIRALLRSDEMQRRIRLEALAIAYPFTLLVIIAVLVFQRLLEIPVEWAYSFLLVTFFFPYFFALKWARERYS